MKLLSIISMALFLVGCGGGSSKGSGQSKPVTPPTEVDAKWGETNWDESDWA